MAFQNLRNNHQIYILHKDASPTLELGKVTHVSVPVPKYGNTGMYNDLVLDITVDIDGKTNNFYLVGENSFGCYAYGGVYSYQGRNGSFSVSLSRTKNEFSFDEKKLELEGIGILPDYWSTNEDLLQTLISITGDKNLQKVLSGIETSLK